MTKKIKILFLRMLKQIYANQQNEIKVDYGVIKEVDNAIREDRT